MRALLPSSGESLVIAVSSGPLYDLDDGDVLEFPLTPDGHTRAGNSSVASYPTTTGSPPAPSPRGATITRRASAAA